MVAEREQHLDAVQRDYDRRTDEWRTIYDGTSFHDHAIAERMRRTLRLVERLPAGGNALDVGCGAGQLVVELARHGYAAHGCDLSSGMVAETKALLDKEGVPGDVRDANVEDLPYDDAEMAIITALGVIEYLPDVERGLAELRRVLRPGGHLVVTAPNPVRLAYLLDPIGTIQGKLRPPKGGYPRRYWPVWSFRRLLRDAGFEVLEVQGHGLGPFTFAGKKLTSEERAIQIGEKLESVLPGPAKQLLGANLIALARRPA